MSKKIIFICPYYSNKKAAAASYIDHLVSRVRDVEYILYAQKKTIMGQKLDVFKIYHYIP